MATTETIIDTTRRLEWKVSKEQFNQCKVGQNVISSQKFKVNIENQISNWKLSIELDKNIEMEDHIGQIIKINETGVFCSLSLLPGDASLTVQVEIIGIKTDLGYRPGESVKNVGGISKIVPKIEHFNGIREEESDYITYVGPKEDFLKWFKNNNVTVVATIRFYMDRNDVTIKKNERNEKFMTQIRSISGLDTLTDFTVICEGREFKCHRVILASRSTVFHAMILNDQFVENRKTSVTIEKASPDSVEAMLEFISKGGIPRNIEENAIDLIDLADRYDLQDLMEICESYLVDNLTVESVIETLIAFDLHIPNSQHRQKILDFIKEEAAEVVKSSHWKTFVEKYTDLVTEIVLSLAPVKDTAK